MINKPILDALAVTIKDERARFENLIADLRKDLVEEGEANDFRLEELEASISKIARSAISSMEGFQASIKDALIEHEKGVNDNVQEKFEEEKELFEEFDRRVHEQRSEWEEAQQQDVQKRWGEIKGELEGLTSSLFDRIAETLANVKNGEDGAPGEPGVAGKDGKDGIDGINGSDGKDGKDGEKGDPGEPGEQGFPGEPGDPGADGADGAEGPQGERGEKGADGRDGIDGINGKDGSDGSDGRDGSDGLDGRNGVDRDLVAPYFPAPNDSLEKNAVAYSQGGLFQAIRKTTGCPKTDPNSYRLIVNGIADIIKRADSDKQTTLIIKLSDGTEVIDDLSIFDGEDGEKGEKGDTGEPGVRGRKGLKGDIGVGIEDLLIENNNIVVTLTNGEAKSLPIEVPTPVERAKTQGVHARAPKNPPKDYIWVTPAGNCKIWDGTQWIKMK